MGLLQLSVPTRPPAAGADDIRPDPGVRGLAQYYRGKRRAWRARTRLAKRVDRPGRRHDLPGLSAVHRGGVAAGRSEEHTSELQALMGMSYTGLCLKKKKESRVMYLD